MVDVVVEPIQVFVSPITLKRLSMFVSALLYLFQQLQDGVAPDKNKDEIPVDPIETEEVGFETQMKVNVKVNAPRIVLASDVTGKLTV